MPDPASNNQRLYCEPASGASDVAVSSRPLTRACTPGTLIRPSRSSNRGNGAKALGIGLPWRSRSTPTWMRSTGGPRLGGSPLYTTT